MRCIRSGMDRCSFVIPCIKANHDQIIRNHRETHLPCDCIVIVDVCKNCHSELPGHIINRIKGLCRISPPGKLPKPRIGVNGRSVLNTCINCPQYNPCKRISYDILFYLAYCMGYITCLNSTGIRNISILQRKFGQCNVKDLIAQLCQSSEENCTKLKETKVD